MKKVGLMAAAMFFAAATFAQTTNPAANLSQPEPTVTHGDKTKMTAGESTQMKELDNCIRNYNSEKAMAKQAIIKGEFDIAKAGYAKAHADKAYIKAIAAQLKSEGVCHPLILAHKEISKADNKLIIADVKIIQADKLAKQKALNAGDSTAVKLAENNLIADKNNLRKDIRDANHDAMKHFALIRLKS